MRRGAGRAEHDTVLSRALFSDIRSLGSQPPLADARGASDADRGLVPSALACPRPALDPWADHPGPRPRRRIGMGRPTRPDPARCGGSYPGSRRQRLVQLAVEERPARPGIQPDVADPRAATPSHDGSGAET